MFTELETWYEQRIPDYREVMAPLKFRNPEIFKNIIPCISGIAKIDSIVCILDLFAWHCLFFVGQRTRRDLAGTLKEVRTTCCLFDSVNIGPSGLSTKTI